MFYAVYIPRANNNKDPINEKECIHIYQDMPSALKVIKEYKEARLKSFENRSDAETYAKTGDTQPCRNPPVPPPIIVVTQEQSNNFKSLKPQELVIFRKLIENGDIKNVRNAVWSNPQYLISCGDTPAILHIGCHYNALHIAVKANEPDICELILKTVGNPAFIQLYYGDDKRRNHLDTGQIMLDLYLNTPDKRLNETPLHFAVKFGYKDIVRILVSYSRCSRTLPNKYNQLPKDIICSRRCQENENLKREIRMLLEDQFYVPVLRAEDNTCQPIIGEPFSPTSTFVNNLNKDPMSPRLEIRAFAGPMTKPQAEVFRKKWKTPPRINPTKEGQSDASSITKNRSANIALRLQDTEKGLERVGRDLAQECQVSWKEYWPFLEDFVDFRNDEGLMKFEKYLEQRFKNHKDQLSYSIMKSLVNDKDADTLTNRQRTMEKTNVMDVSEIQGLCDKMHSCSLNTKADEKEVKEDIDLEFFTPPSSPEPIRNDSDDDMESAEEEGPAIFIEGFSPTKIDYAVYNALSSTISPHSYPYIYYWRHDLQLAIQRNPCRFQDTRKLRRKLFTNT